MTAVLPLLVFSDLDGTLLDHETYRWDAAQEALTALAELGAGVILASSKTVAEISILQAEMGLQGWPAIVENGAGLLREGLDDSAYQQIRAALGRVPVTLRKFYTGFGDLDAEGVARITGLSQEAAVHAKNRQFSEPGTWSGTEADRTAFLALLAAEGITAREGGRFLTLSFGKTKADQMDALITRYAPHFTAALGDAPNDVEMLQKADLGVVISNPHRPPLPPLEGEENGRIIRTQAAGPAGWNDAVLQLLCDLQLTKG